MLGDGIAIRTVMLTLAFMRSSGLTLESGPGFAETPSFGLSLEDGGVGEGSLLESPPRRKK